MNLWQLYKKFITFLLLPILLQDFFAKSTGRDYRINFITKLKLTIRFYKNTKIIKSGSGFIEHLMMATKLLRFPKTFTGDVVECGTYKGASAANLSLICALTGRTLHVFDSFAGLPKVHRPIRQVLLDNQELHEYSSHSWRGTLTEVKTNIARWGNIKSCRFCQGEFSKTLPKFKTRCVLIFLDVDLTSSLKTCLLYLWPILVNRGFLFTHEAQHKEISQVFFDKLWWKKYVKASAPTLVGAGTGLGLIPTQSGFKSDLAYTIKNPELKKFTVKIQSAP